VYTPFVPGSQWSVVLDLSPLKRADFVLVLDCDIPWIKSVFCPAALAKVYQIDCDPLKVNMSLFQIGTELSCNAHARTALDVVFISASQTGKSQATVLMRTKKLRGRHDAYRRNRQTWRHSAKR
jgi:acetolactate synthase-1/2/3 large subunit